MEEPSCSRQRYRAVCDRTLEDAGLLSKEKLLAGEIPVGPARGQGDDDNDLSDSAVFEGEAMGEI